MMFCARCGAINPDTNHLCRKCGASLQAQAQAPTAFKPPDQFAPGVSQDGTRVPFEQRPTIPFMSFPDQAWLMPIPHSPFNEEPLISLSGSMPAVTRPADEMAPSIPGRPISRNLFSEDPLPQPSGPMPTLTQSADKVAPSASELPSSPFPLKTTNNILPGMTNPNPPARLDRPIADYPTRIDMSISSMRFPEIQESVSPVSFIKANVSASPKGVPEPYQNFFTTLPESEINKGNSRPPFLIEPTSEPLGNIYPSFTGEEGMVRFENQSMALAIPKTQMSKLIRPLPAWIFWFGIFGVSLLLAALIFLNPDWATGAVVAGVVAIIVALLILNAFGVRLALGMLSVLNSHRRSQILSTILLVLLLFVFSGISIAQPFSIHAMQARYLESQHNWQLAINEYQAAGQSAPASTDLARIYNEWGEALSGQQQYGDAVAKFNTVLSIYAQVPAQDNLARINTIDAYVAWGDSGSRYQDYVHATLYYDTLLSLSYCGPNCQAQVQPKDATAYYELAEQQLAAKQFTSAVNAFGTLTVRFAKFPQARQVHQDYAQALWHQGQQQLSTTCSDAVKTYQQLAQQFADTAQGKQAATALQQPVNVKGHFTQSVPGAPYTPTAILVQGLFVGIQQYQFPPLIANAPTAQINSNGTFTFSSVPQGTYELVWSDDGRLHFYYAFNGNQILYTANLGPLCMYNYGNIDATIPMD